MPAAVVMRVLVTGTAGFVGPALCSNLVGGGWDVTALDRRESGLPEGCASRIIADIGPGTDWSGVLDGVDAVVHLAARAHVMKESAADPLAAFRRTNVAGTLGLAHAAAQAGVRRFVFLSSIKVNGESTAGEPFSESTPAAPTDPYGLSKWEAEQGLAKVAAQSELEVVILRPPLVYGPEVKGNFLRLLAAIDRGLPLPLASVENRRSLIGLSNLVDFLTVCVDHPVAAGETFLIADGEDLSTPELTRRLAQALGRPARLWPCSVSLMRLAAQALGKQGEIERLCGSLTVDSQKARSLLSWSPVVPMNMELARVARWWRARSTGL